MSKLVFDCEQRSEEWFRLRAGIPTASEFSTIMMQGKGGGESKTRATYMRKLAGEIVTGEPMENYTNQHMDRGREMEEEARTFYAFMQDQHIERVGFIRNGNVGCSPDGLIGTGGMNEIKTALPHILIEMLLKDTFPPEHKAQCQGALWIAEREWIDLTVYWPKMPGFVKRAFRDETYIADLKSEVARFQDELDKMVKIIRSYEVRKAA